MIKDSILVKYFLGESSEKEKEAVEAYKASAPEEFARLQKLWTNREEINLHSFNRREAWKKISSKTLAPGKRRRKIFMFRAAAAVLILLLALCLWLIINHQSGRWDVYADTQSPILLKDGTQIWLNQGAQLEAPASFKGKTRPVRLRGEAFFEVAENPDKPFIIQNETLEIEVLGTSFNVQAQQVSVASGRVAVNSNLSQNQIILERGEAATLKGDNLVATVVDPNFQAWRTGIFEFDKVALIDVIEALNRYYTLPFSLQDEQADCQVSIEFNQDSRAEVIESLEIICGVEIN